MRIKAHKTLIISSKASMIWAAFKNKSYNVDLYMQIKSERDASMNSWLDWKSSVIRTTLLRTNHQSHLWKTIKLIVFWQIRTLLLYAVSIPVQTKLYLMSNTISLALYPSQWRTLPPNATPRNSSWNGNPPAEGYHHFLYISIDYYTH